MNAKTSSCTLHCCHAMEEIPKCSLSLFERNSFLVNELVLKLWYLLDKNLIVLNKTVIFKIIIFRTRRFYLTTHFDNVFLTLQMSEMRKKRQNALLGFWRCSWSHKTFKLRVKNWSNWYAQEKLYFNLKDKMDWRSLVRHSALQ